MLYLDLNISMAIVYLQQPVYKMLTSLFHFKQKIEDRGSSLREEEKNTIN